MSYSLAKFISRHWTTIIIVTISLMLFICGILGSEIIVRQSRSTGIELADNISAGQQSILSMVVGRLEGLVGDLMVVKADAYFHGMSSYMEYVASHNAHGEECHELEGVEDVHEHHEHHEHHGHVNSEEGHIESGFNHFFLKKYRTISSSEHIHLKDDKELLPWLAASIRLNPHNIRAFIISAYWVGHRLNKPDQAERVIREGLRYNNTNWQLRCELGKILASRNEYEQAIVQYSNAVRFFPKQPYEGAELDLANIWRLIGGAYEDRCDYGRAVQAYSNVVRLHPIETSYRKLEELKRKALSASASDSLAN